MDRSRSAKCRLFGAEFTLVNPTYREINLSATSVCRRFPRGWRHVCGGCWQKSAASAIPREGHPKDREQNQTGTFAPHIGAE